MASQSPRWTRKAGNGCTQPGTRRLCAASSSPPDTSLRAEPHRRTPSPQGTCCKPLALASPDRCREDMGTHCALDGGAYCPALHSRGTGDPPGHAYPAGHRAHCSARVRLVALPNVPISQLLGSTVPAPHHAPAVHCAGVTVAGVGHRKPSGQRPAQRALVCWATTEEPRSPGAHAVGSGSLKASSSGSTRT